MANTAENNAYAALQNADFRLYLLGRFCMIAALEMLFTVMGWQIYSVTKNPLALGYIGLAEALPFIVTSLYSGHLADNYNRKKIILTFDSLLTILCGLLCWVNWVHSGWLQAHISMSFYSAIFLIGMARGFMAPSISSLMPTILPRELYVNGASWNSNAWHTAAISGPAIGGLIYGFGGANSAYLTVVLLAAISWWLFNKVKYNSNTTQKKRDPVWQSLREGASFVFNRPILLGSIALDMFAVLFGGAVALLPIFASDVLHVGPQGLGFLRAAPMVGSIIMGLFLAYNPISQNAGLKLLGAVAAFGLCIIGFAFSTNFYLSFVLLLFSGVFDNISVVVRSTLLQLLPPNDMRGRVSALNGIFLGVSNEIGAFESGLAARLLGLVPSVVFGGCMTLLVVVMAYFAVPQFRHLNLRKLE